MENRSHTDDEEHGCQYRFGFNHPLLFLKPDKEYQISAFAERCLSIVSPDALTG